VAHLRAARAADPELLRRLVAGADRLDEALIAAVAVAARLQEPLRALADAGAERAAALGTDLARVGGLGTKRAGSRRAVCGRRRLERARLGGEGQIRMLHVDEPERELTLAS
jgi:hypothetical protein